MKRILILLCLPLMTLAQQPTYVPDDNFEAYLEANGMGNGIANDDYVTTANINTVTSLDVSYESISDLTGIQDFTALTYLNCRVNQLTSLDVSGATALTSLDCGGNQLTSLDVSQNTALEEYLGLGNQLTSLDISNNTALTTLSCDLNQLTSLDVSQNTALEYLGCGGNQLTSLDVSQNTALTGLDCSSNQLTSLDVRNGNNTNFSAFYATSTPILSCINVDDFQYSLFNWNSSDFGFDTQHYFSNNCSGATAIEEHTTPKELLKVTDLLGRETKGTKNEVLFYLYDDGTVEKRIVIE